MEQTIPSLAADQGAQMPTSPPQPPNIGHVPPPPPDNNDTATAREASQQESSCSRDSAPPSDATATVLAWRPSYLRRRVLILFCAAFVALAVSAEVILAVSNRQQGLASSTQRLRYLWTFGPAAILTLMAGLWNRVDYQAKLAAPWIHLSAGLAPAERTLLLDYLDMLWPHTIIREAVRYRDWAVAAATAVALALRLAILLSTSIITLSPTDIAGLPVPVTITSAFVDDASGLQDIGTLALVMMQGLSANNLTHPYGTSAQFAFQTVAGSDVPENGTLHVTVDGFSAGLACDEATLRITGIDRQDDRAKPGTQRMNVTLANPSCRLDLTFNPPEPRLGPEVSRQRMGVARFGAGVCDGAADSEENNRFGLFFAMADVEVIEVDDDSGLTWTEKKVTVLKSQQLVCKPRYNVNRLDIVVTNDADVSSISVANDTASASVRQLGHVNSWDIARAYLASSWYGSDPARSSNSSNSVDYGGFYGTNFSGSAVDADHHSLLMLGYEMGTARWHPNASTLLDMTYLTGVLTRYYQQSAALVAHYGLTEAASTSTTGTASVRVDRLVVRSASAHATTGLLSLAVVFALVVLFAAPREGILPRSPTTIAAVASFLRDSRRLTDSLQWMGMAGLGTLKRVLGQSFFGSWAAAAAVVGGRVASPQFGIHATRATLPDDDVVSTSSEITHPMVLRPYFRVSVLALAVGVLIALEVVLQQSNRAAGLGDVADEDGLHYLWTILPTLVFSLLGLFLAAVDLQCRILAPFVNLIEQPCSFKSSIGLDLQNKMLPFVCWTEMRTKNWAALALTLAGFIGSLFTTFSASLYAAQSFPVTSVVQLQATTSFGLEPRDSTEDPPLTASLILIGGLPYPDSTHLDMAFPSFQSAVGSNLGAASSLTATVPAIRPRLTCRAYAADEIKITGDFGNTMTFEIPGKGPINGVFSDYALPVTSKCVPPGPCVFGAAMTDWQGDNEAFWIWGNVRLDASTTVSSSVASGLSCNRSLELVDVETTLVGPQLRIDPTRPPRPIEASARTPSLAGYQSLVLYYESWRLAISHTAPALLDNFFSVLVSSPNLDVSLSSLNDTAQASRVAAAVRLQHGMIMTQVLSAWYRTPADTVNMTLAHPPTAVSESNDASVRYAANVTDPAGRRRVTQDATATRVLEGLLAAALVLSLAGWARMRRTGVLPRPATSIANVAALVAGGNLLENLAWEDGLHRGLRSGRGEKEQPTAAGTRFCMTWKRIPVPGLENRFGIWVTNAPEDDDEHGSFQSESPGEEAR